MDQSMHDWLYTEVFEHYNEKGAAIYRADLILWVMIFLAGLMIGHLIWG